MATSYVIASMPHKTISTAIAVCIASLLVTMIPFSAKAQRMSLADRVTTLEARAANSQANVDLLNQVTALKGEVQALRAQLEEMQQAQEQAARTARAQYLDVDGRVTRLEGGTPAAPAPAGAGTAASATPPATAPAESVERVAPVDSTPRVYGDAGTLALGADERRDYDTAFAALRAGQYAESARLFQAFLDVHANGSYAPNALYWLGESYYVTQNYTLALSRFQTLLDRHPTHDKAAGALLKVGLSQQGLQQLDAAQRSFEQVIARYPASDAARTARDRLQALELQRMR